MKERTLVIIKPDIVKKNMIPELMVLCTENFKIIDIVMHHLTYEEAADFYQMHSGKDFYNRLCDFMSSGKCVAIALEGENAIAETRRRIEDEIRPNYTETVTCNAVHGSDSSEDAKREIKFFFGKI